ncbi:hypothetical protein NLJ89_g10354 [Agrocybe chaxingu]|uniref:Uncharacterized protein n=1 Tax=Agrocybe chaxingu TaxID=84603 RepID=A0A9W8JRG1_9AGAR|nr:hypothetical protein NLJ89_g10354 [Agrocybe chaxingu]
MSAEDRSGIVYHIQQGDMPVTSSQILDLSLPWSQLVMLDLRAISLAPNVVLVLMHRTAMSLQEASFHVDSDANTPIAFLHRPLMDPPNVRMTALKKLAVTLGGGRTEAGLFHQFLAPRLKELRVEMAHANTEGWSLPLFRPLIALCSRKLEVLELIDSQGHAAVLPRTPERRPLTHLELEALLQLIPNVHVLRLPRSLFAHHTTLRKLGNGHLLPSLKTLGVTASSLANAEDILVMIAERMRVIEAARRGVGTSSINVEGGINLFLEEERHAEAITDVVLRMTLAERGVFVKDVLPKYLSGLGDVEIQVEAL